MRYASKFQAFMRITCPASLICMVAFFAVYHFTQIRLFFSLGVTMLTVFYHFAMRLFVGEVLFRGVKAERIDCNAKWFAPKRFEAKLYKALKLKKWKSDIPTYDPREFSLEEHTLDEIIGATCRSELIHETIMLASFVPLLFTLFFGAFAVFLITSIVAACIDTLFVLLQRFNRPRLIKLMRRKPTPLS